jgi:predicted phage baseplate assembly protein
VAYDPTPLFGVDFQAQYQTDLDNGTLPQDFQQPFANHNIEFQSLALSVQGRQAEWSISDGTHAYIVRREGNQLNIYPIPEAATQMMNVSPREALPMVTLESESESGDDKAMWRPKRDLLNSDPTANEFVVEIETDGTAFLRFGDDQFGRRPASGTKFTATYRVGNGIRGNIGANALAHVVSHDSGIENVSNPLPAQGGTELESIKHARQMAPYAFRKQERAVTPDDYAAVATLHPHVQRAAATLRWTGSWHTVFLTIDRQGGLDIDAAFEKEMQRHLERYRMAGHDVEIDSPRFVSLEIEMRVCVKPDYFRSDVVTDLRQRLSNGTTSDGQRGFFHPDNFTFGQSVYLSQLYAVAESVAGVAFADITTFQRQGTPSRQALDDGKLTVGRLEFARLDNEPNFPEHGVLRLKPEGGK